MMKKYLVLIIFFVLLLNSCSEKTEETTTQENETKLEMVDANYVLESVDNSDIVLLDVRTEKEFSEGHIPNAVMVDWYSALNENGDLKSVGELESLFSNVDKNKEIIVYCRSGRRAGLAAEVMAKELGFENIKIYQGSMNDWNSKNLTIEQ